MRSIGHWAIGCTSAFLVSIGDPSAAIEVYPSSKQIQAALDRGTHAAAQHQPPEQWYARFGGKEELDVGGFLVTKLGGVSVLATHMALRGLEPSAADIAQVVDVTTMLVSAVIFGDSSAFAMESYIVLDQGGRVIKPVTVRVDGQATRTTAWPESPRFTAKVVAAFQYADFDPNAHTTITVFPATGGEIRFAVNFKEVE
ncbi:MAG: hypothetical protein IPM58_03540 [Nitrospira sp.]|nr:hypothetical protein [Nitrospira sp.]